MATKIYNLTGPTGPSGDTGSDGLLISTDPNNVASVGSDNRLYVPAPTPPLASPATSGLVRQLSGNALTDFVDGTNACQNLANAEAPVIWSVRNRSYNAFHNPNFEVDQRHYFNPASSNPPNLYFGADRWRFDHTALSTGTYYLTVQTASTASPNSLVPNTRFLLEAGYNSTASQMANGLYIFTGNAQATLAAGDYLYMMQFMAGPDIRELLNGPFSVTILAYTVYTPPFSFFVRDNGAAHSYTKLINPANFPTDAATGNAIITIPNISWSASGNYPITPGSYGATFGICLAAGSTFTAPADGVWSNGNFLASPGSSNFYASINNSISLYFMQIEPGPVCTQLMDIPFVDNYRTCQRFFCMNAPYGTLPGQGLWHGLGFFVSGQTCRLTNAAFPFEMATTPTCTMYGSAGGVNQHYIDNIIANAPVSSVVANTKNIQTVTTTSSYTGTIGNATLGSWSADTGW